MKKLWWAVVMGIMFVAGIGIGFFAAKRSAAPPSPKPEREQTLEEKMMGWIVNNKFPESPVKEKCVSVPVSLLPKGYDRYGGTVTDVKIPVTEIDLDDDGQPEWLVYTGSGNRNTTYITGISTVSISSSASIRSTMKLSKTPETRTEGSITRVNTARRGFPEEAFLSLITATDTTQVSIAPD